MRKMVLLGVIVITIILSVIDGDRVLLSQDQTILSTPICNQPFAGDLSVAGKTVPGSAPITVFDIDSSFEVPTPLGSGVSMDVDGNFAVCVDPPLVEGHTIIVVDVQGRASQPMPVLPAGSPAGVP